jgi:hypothetical protein
VHRPDNTLAMRSSPFPPWPRSCVIAQYKGSRLARLAQQMGQRKPRGSSRHQDSVWVYWDVGKGQVR